MTRHAPILTSIGLVMLVAAFISPGHAILLAGGFMAGAAMYRRHAAWQNQPSPPRRDVASQSDFSDSPLLNALPLPTILIDKKSIVLKVNPEALAAYPALRTSSPLSLALRDPALLGAVADTITHGVRHSVEIVEKVPIERVFTCTASPLVAQRGGAAAMLVLQETSKERAVEAMRVDFIANASHELRTPLASILGFIETLQGPARDDVAARDRFLGVMLQQARRMARLVDDLLSLSRIELKEHIAPTEVVDLGAVTNDLSLALSELARERGVEIAIVRETTDTQVTGDRDELASALENLIENAIKYGKDGGKVDIRLFDGGTSDLSVSIRDYGQGIAPEYLPRLTERFYRIDSALSRAEGGTGLGLALVKHTVSRHRGRLSIDSQPGRGANFTITLPRPHGLTLSKLAS